MSSNPNIAIVVLDTARAQDALFTTPTVMPTLRELGEDGTTYENAYASAPWTLPSHASLFTGTYPSKNGAHGDNTHLPSHNRTLAEAFASSGYETIAVSNNTWITEDFGFDAGFETFWKGWQYYQSETDLGVIAHELGTMQKLRTAANHIFEGNPLINAANLCYSELIQSRTDDGAQRTTDRIESWLAESDDDRPFFLFANYIEPHIEYRPPKEHTEPFLPGDETYEEALEVRQEPCAYNVGNYELCDREFDLLRALYRGEMAYVDEHLDRIKTALEAEDEWEDTILVVLGDHGENLGDHGFLGHQYNIYDTLLHVPLVINGGAFNDGPSQNDQLVQIPDIVPSLLDETASDDAAIRNQSQGVSFHPESTEQREQAIAEYISPQPPVKTLEESFEDIAEYVSRYDRTLRAIRTNEYKLVVGSDGTEKLYHVATDPGERNDQSAKKPERTEQLKNELDGWLDSFEHADADTETEISGATKERLADLGYM